ncbi:MAG: alpha-amylase [Rhodoluna sp.]
MFRLLALAVIAALVPAGMTAATTTAAAATETQVVSTSSVGVQLFEWNWNSVARECTTNLGPAGYDWVEVSPPQEHILGSKWWVHYQPTSYKLESSLGTREQFAAMVDTCGKAGVSIIVDAVINHMAASDTNGWAGTKHGKYDYPGLYTSADFHHCKSKSGGIENWNDLTQVQECELLGLADLNTSSPTVQAKIVAYLNDLLSLGVKGFRVDAAKHIAVADLKQIVAALPSDTSFLYEVYDGPAAPSQYRTIGNTFGFDWAKSTKSMFTVPGLLKGEASSAVLRTLDKSDATINLVANHDTERDGSTLNYKAGKRFELASMFMLAIPYGKPMIFSGYAFSDRDAAPFSDNYGYTKDATCPTISSASAKAPTDGNFVCEHRWSGITGLIQWRKAVGTAPVQGVYSQGNAYGFARGKLGWVLFNTGTAKFTKTVKTSMAAGTYCNLAVSGALAADATCPSGARVVVAKDGSTKLNLAGWSAVAISASTKLK